MDNETRVKKLAEVMALLAELPPIHWLDVEAFIVHLRRSRREVL